MFPKNPPVLQIKINDYPTEYIISKNVRPKFYTREDKIPKKYLNDPNLDFVSFDVTKNRKKTEIEFLTNIYTGERVIKNINKANKVLKKPINSGDLHECTMLPYTRANIILTIKNHCKPIIEKIILEHPLFFPLKAHFIFNSSTGQDLGNHIGFYEKVIMDLLQEYNIIPNDSKEFINGLYFDILPNFGKNILTVNLYNNESI